MREDGIATPPAKNLHERAAALLRQFIVTIAGGRRLGYRRHEFLDQQAPAGLQCRNHPRQCRLALRHEGQHGPLVNEIEGASGKLIDADVMATHLDIGSNRCGYPVGIDVGCDHAAGGADAFAHEPRYRPAACADLETMPTRADSEPIEMAAGSSVLELGKIREPFAGLWGSVVERILRSRPRRFDDHVSPEVLSYSDGLTKGGTATEVIPEVSAEVFTSGERPLLLDREDDLAAIDAALAEAVGGMGGILLIEGPPGIGKTALLNELRKRACALGMTVRAARGGELERGFGFGIVRQLLEAPLVGADAAERARLLAGAARLSEPVFTDIPALGETRDVAFATLHGLYWLVANLTERAPLILAVDDAQWADEPSLRFLLHLANRLAGLPVIVALTVRAGADMHRPGLSSLLLEARPPILRPRAAG